MRLIDLQNTIPISLSNIGDCLYFGSIKHALNYFEFVSSILLQEILQNFYNQQGKIIVKMVAAMKFYNLFLQMLNLFIWR